MCVSGSHQLIACPLRISLCSVQRALVLHSCQSMFMSSVLKLLCETVYPCLVSAGVECLAMNSGHVKQCDTRFFLTLFEVHQAILRSHALLCCLRLVAIAAAAMLELQEGPAVSVKCAEPQKQGTDPRCSR
jgi:hypothetical protein